MSTAFENACERICDSHLRSVVFEKTTLLKCEFLVSMNRTVLESFMHKRLRANFLTHEIMAFGTVKFLIVDRFLKFLNFLPSEILNVSLKTTLAYLSLWVQFKERVVRSSFAHAVTPKLF